MILNHELKPNQFCRQTSWSEGAQSQRERERAKGLFIQNATANAAWRRSWRNGQNKTNYSGLYKARKRMRKTTLVCFI